MNDCASRIRNRVQITADGLKVYLDAVENAFGADIDYANYRKFRALRATRTSVGILQRSASAVT